MQYSQRRLHRSASATRKSVATRPYVSDSIIRAYVHVVFGWVGQAVRLPRVRTVTTGSGNEKVLTHWLSLSSRVRPPWVTGSIRPAPRRRRGRSWPQHAELGRRKHPGPWSSSSCDV